MLPEALNGNRRSALAIAELLPDCAPVVREAPLSVDVVETVLDDFALGGDADREWSAYAARLCLSLAHEEALAPLSGGEKAQLRDVWRNQFGAAIARDSHSTVDFVHDIRRAFKETTAPLVDRNSDPRQLAGRIQERVPSLRPFLDDQDLDLLADTVEVLQEYVDTRDSSGFSSLLAEQIEACRRQSRDLAESGSITLQDLLGPAVASAATDLAHYRRSLADTSRPELSLRLITDRLPLSAAENEVVQARFMVANEGNVDALRVSLHLESHALMFADVWETSRISPGGQDEAVVEALVGEPERSVPILASLRWSDSLRQDFEVEILVNVEDQRPSSWASSDTNPFTLAVVTDPDMLIGRADVIDALGSSLSAGTSVSITGQKRVGKSSIARTLLASPPGNEWATEYLPLGRAVNNEGVAGDLVHALLRRIGKAVAKQWPHIALPVLDAEGSARNFPLIGGEWISDVAGVLAPNANVVIVIDDFDELPPQMREGAEADSLFLFLRSLIDEPWLSLVFIGSEVLPTIIASQAHKLNQVVPYEIHGFETRNSTALLLRQLSGHRIDWDGEAIDAIHHLTAGIPYYSRQIASEIWTSLKQRDRTYAQKSDVDAAVALLSRSSSVNHYTHLWADDSQGMGLRERRSALASAVLRAVAHCTGPQLGAVPTDEVVNVAQGWMGATTRGELHDAVSRLVSRGILRPGPNHGTVEQPLGLASLWLLGAGGPAVEHYYADSYHAHERAATITGRELVDLAGGLEYVGDRISETRLKAWLEQFTDGDHRRLAFLMMRRLISEGFFPANAIPPMIDDLRRAIVLGEAGRHQKLDKFKRLTNYYLVEHGAAGGSSQAMLSPYAKQLRIAKTTNVVSRQKFAEKVHALNASETVVALILDDFAGTGNQLRDAATGFVDYMDAHGGDLWRERVITVAGAALCDEKFNWTPPEGVTGYGVFGREVSTRLRAFHPDAELFSNDDERDQAQDLMRTIGGSLVRNSPLGFGESALLVCMYNNCPNNTLPAFWANGRFAGEKWMPLFERRF